MNNSPFVIPDPIVSKHGIVVSSMCHRQKTEIHIHNYVHLWYALAGECVHTLGDKTYIQSPGICIVVPSNMPHSIDTTGSEETPVIFSIYLNDDFLLSHGYKFCSYFDKRVIFRRYLIPEFYKLPEDDRERANELARSMLSEFSDYSKATLDSIFLKLELFLSLICIKCENSRLTEVSLDNARRVNTTIKYMEEHYRKKITLDDLCKLTALSHYGFTKKFKEITGLTAMEYLHRLRLTRARHLLIFTEKSLSRIAEEVGFYDKSRLIRAFREFTGFSPAEFRKQERPRSYQDDFNTKKRRDRLREIVRNTDA